MDSGAKTEKVSVNMNISTLAYIDILVDNGFYSNRSDFINQAVREYLTHQKSILDRIIDRNTENGQTEEFRKKRWFVGIMVVSRQELEEAAVKGEKIKFVGYGMLLFEEDCDDELIMGSVQSIAIRGKVRCSPTVKKFFGI